MNQKLIMKTLAVIALLGTQQGASAQKSSDVQSPAGDNSAINKRDRDGKRPSQLKGDANDVEITRRIRQALVEDGTLSTNAQNVKITTVQGTVTLRGPVDDVTEKERVISAAQKIAGEKNVRVELDEAKH